MAADTTMTIYGSWHLAGKMAAVVVAGIDMGDFLVAANGSVSVPYGSDPGGLITPAYLGSHAFPASDHDATFTVNDGTNSLLVTVPILVGLRYTSQGQLLKPNSEAQLQAGQGFGQGKTRRAGWASFLVKDLLALKIGTSFLQMKDVQLTFDGGITPELVMPEDVSYSGVFVQPLSDTYGFDAQLSWASDRAYPVVIAGAEIFLDAGYR